jgi:hypothetical protein
MIAHLFYSPAGEGWFDRPMRSAQLTLAGIDPPVRHEPGAITVRVRSILDHEVIAVDVRAPGDGR